MKRLIINFLLGILLSSVCFAGLGSDGLQVISGQWDVDDNKNVYSLENTKKSVAVLEDDFNEGETVVKTLLRINDFKSQNGYLIFDYVDSNNFKYAGMDADKNRLVLGQFEFGAFKESNSIEYEIDPGYDYPVELKIQGGIVTFKVNDGVLRKNFPLVANRNMGFATKSSDTIFKHVSINTTEKQFESRFPNIFDVKATTGTGLDETLDIIKNDEGLNKYVPQTDILEGMFHTNELNRLLVRSIIDSGVANDGYLSVLDMKILDGHIFRNYFVPWAAHHGDDDNGVEFGFHLTQHDGATSTIFGENAVNTVIDGMHHLGYGSANAEKSYNEDFNDNQQYSDIAMWLNGFLKEDLKGSKLRNSIGADHEISIASGDALAQENYIYVGAVDSIAISIFEDRYESDDLVVNMNMELTPFEKAKNGFIIFDIKHAENFKYAGVSPDAKNWVIGEYKSGEWNHLASKKDALVLKRPYNLRLTLIGGKATLNVNQFDVASYDFDTSFSDEFGIGTYKAAAIFSDIRFDGDKKSGLFSKIISWWKKGRFSLS